jgi:hypothetical protein
VFSSGSVCALAPASTAAFGRASDKRRARFTSWMIPSCKTFLLNRRKAFSKVSPSWSLTSAKSPPLSNRKHCMVQTLRWSYPVLVFSINGTCARISQAGRVCEFWFHVLVSTVLLESNEITRYNLRLQTCVAQTTILQQMESPWILMIATDAVLLDGRLIWRSRT